MEVQDAENPISDKTWHYVAISVTVVSALMSYNTANTYNELSEKILRLQHNTQTPTAALKRHLTKSNMTAMPQK